jgi:hypothetical protein
MASRKDVVAGGASIEIKAVDYTKQVFGQVGANMDRLGLAAMKFGGGLIAGAAAAVTALGGLTVTSAAAAAAIDDASQRTGATVEALQELRYAGDMSDASFEGIIKGFRALALAMSNDTGRKKLEDLGLSLAALEQMSPEERFLAVGDAIGKLGDETARTAAANEIFGKSGQELLPLFQQGAEAIAGFRQEARDLGQVIDAEGITALASFDDAVVKITGTLKGLAITLASQLAPYFQPVADGIARVVGSVSNWLKANSGFAAGLLVAIGVVGAIGTAIFAFGAVLSGVVFIVTSAIGVISGIASAIAFLFSPLGAVIAAVTALGIFVGVAAVALAALLIPFIDLEGIVKAVGEAFAWLRTQAEAVVAYLQQTFATTIQGLGDAFANGDLIGAARIAFLTVQLIATQAWEKIMAGAGQMFGAITAGFGTLIPGIKDAALAFEEVNKAAQRGIELDLQMAAKQQANRRKDRENAALEKAEKDAANQSLFGDALNDAVAEKAADTAKALDPAAVADKFDAGFGTSVSGAAAFMGGVTAFKPLEEEAKKQTAHLAQIEKQTRDGLGAQIA